MRLSEDRIEFINKQILDALITEGLAEVRGRVSTLLAEMSRAVMNDLGKEDKIDAEVDAMIKKMKRDIPEGSSEYRSIFIKKKDELAARYNYIL